MDKAMDSKSCQGIRVELRQRLQRIIRTDRLISKIVLSQLLANILGTRTAGIIEKTYGRQTIKVFIESRQQGGTLQYS